MVCVSILEICFFDIIIVCDVIHSWRQQNMSNKWIRKHVTDLKNSPRSFCVDVIKLCSLSGFLRFDLSYLNFMKIQSSYLLLIYQRNQASIPRYIGCFLNNFWWVYVSNHDIWQYIRDPFVTRFCFWNAVDGHGKLT